MLMLRWKRAISGRDAVLRDEAVSWGSGDWVSFWRYGLQSVVEAAC